MFLFVGDLTDETISFVKMLQDVDPECNLCKVGLACVAVQKSQWLDALAFLNSMKGTLRPYVNVEMLMLMFVRLPSPSPLLLCLLLHFR